MHEYPSPRAWYTPTLWSLLWCNTYTFRVSQTRVNELSNSCDWVVMKVTSWVCNCWNKDPINSSEAESAGKHLEESQKALWSHWKFYKWIYIYAHTRVYSLIDKYKLHVFIIYHMVFWNKLCGLMNTLITSHPCFLWQETFNSTLGSFKVPCVLY